MHQHCKDCRSLSCKLYGRKATAVTILRHDMCHTKSRTLQLGAVTPQLGHITRHCNNKLTTKEHRNAIQFNSTVDCIVLYTVVLLEEVNRNTATAETVCSTRLLTFWLRKFSPICCKNYQYCKGVSKVIVSENTLVRQCSNTEFLRA